MDGRQLEIRIEDANIGGVTQHLGGRREERGRLGAGGGQRVREAGAEADIGHGGAAGSNYLSAVGAAEARGTGVGLSRNGSGDRGDLEGIHGIERDAVTRAHYGSFDAPGCQAMPRRGPMAPQL